MSKTVESIRRSLDPALSDRFSEIELLIMSCLCEGMSNAEVASHCNVSESVVKTRVAVIQRKTGLPYGYIHLPNADRDLDDEARRACRRPSA